MPIDNTNPKTSFHNAGWVTHETDGEVCLQIELGNDYAVLLTCRPNEIHQASRCGAATASIASPIQARHPDRFRQWIGRRSMTEPFLCLSQRRA